MAVKNIKILIWTVVSLLLVFSVFADTYTTGDSFTTPVYQTTYNLSQDITLTDLALGNYCLNITGGDGEGDYCVFNYTSIFKESDNQINCKFPVTDNITNGHNISVTWYNSTDNITYVKDTTYDYTFVDLALGTYSTDNGTGSVVNPADASYWKCEVEYQYEYFDNLLYNSSTVKSTPLIFNIISPLNNTQSNESLNVTFFVSDEDGGINCSLQVNDDIVNVTSLTINISNLTRYYTFDYEEDVNDLIYDYFNHSAVVEGAKFTEDGIINGAYDFTFTSTVTHDNIGIPPSADINALADFTFSFWVKPDTLTSPNTVALLINDNSTGNLVQIEYTTTSHAPAGRLQYFDGTVYTGADTLTAGSWSHIVFTRSGSTLTLYLNGVKDSGGTHNIGTTPLPSAGYNLGSWQVGGAPDEYGFDGKMDEVAIWNYTIKGPATNCGADNTSDVCSLYASGAPGILQQPPFKTETNGSQNYLLKSGQIHSVNYTLPHPGTYNWNLSCIAIGASRIYSGNYTYYYQTNAEIDYVNISDEYPEWNDTLDCSFNITKNGFIIVNATVGWYNTTGDLFQLNAETNTVQSIHQDELNLYANYTKKNNNTPLWQVKHGNLDTYNITLPDACVDAYDTYIYLRIHSKLNFSGDSARFTQPYCYNGASWQAVGIKNTTFGSYASSDVAVATEMYDGNYNTEVIPYLGVGGFRHCNSASCKGQQIFEESMYWQGYKINPYTFTNITNNTVYTTGVGTGSVVGNLGNYSNWTCNVEINYLNNSKELNSSTVYVYPLETLTIYNPTEGYELSNETFNLTYSVVADSGGIECNLTINGTLTNTTNPTSRVNDTIIYVLPSEGYYSWNFTCGAIGKPNLETSLNNIYAYDFIPSVINEVNATAIRNLTGNEIIYSYDKTGADFQKVSSIGVGGGLCVNTTISRSYDYDFETTGFIRAVSSGGAGNYYNCTYDLYENQTLNPNNFINQTLNYYSKSFVIMEEDGCGHFAPYNFNWGRVETYFWNYDSVDWDLIDDTGILAAPQTMYVNKTFNYIHYIDSNNNFRTKIQTQAFDCSIGGASTITGFYEQNISYVNVIEETIYPRWNDTIDCTFNVTEDFPEFDVTVSWYNSTNLSTELVSPTVWFEPFYAYFNYIHANTLLVKHGQLSTYEIVLPNGCRDQTEVQVRAYSYMKRHGIGNADGTSYTQCYNGTTWETIGSTETTAGVSGTVYSFSGDRTRIHDGDFNSFAVYAGVTPYGSGTSSWDYTCSGDSCDKAVYYEVEAYDNRTYWENTGDYDYTYTNVLNNTLYRTEVGTGSIPQPHSNYTHWICNVDVTGYYNITENATVRSMYPLENLTINSPGNLTISNETLIINFNVTDDNQGINCSLYVDDVLVNSNSSLSRQDGTVNYTFPQGGVYTWYLSCIGNGFEYWPVTTGLYNYTYDINGPTYTNYTDDSTSIFPEIDDNISLSVIVYDWVNISVCKLQMNDNGVWQNKSTYIIETPYMYTLNMTYEIQSYSNSTNNISWSVWCNDSFNNVNVSAIQWFEVKDNTAPNITINSGNFFSTDNQTIISSYLYNGSLDITFTDYNLFQAEVNVTCDTNGTIYEFQQLDYNGSSFTLNEIINFHQMIPQKCQINISATDDHTANLIPDYQYEILENGIRYFTENNNVIDVINTETPLMFKNVGTQKDKDRYKFNFEFYNKKLENTFIIKANNKIYYRTESGDAGHFVIWNEEVGAGNWIDFFEEGMPLKHIKDRSYEVLRISDYEYQIKISAEVPSNEVEWKDGKGFIEEEMFVNVEYEEVEPKKNTIGKNGQVQKNNINKKETKFRTEKQIKKIKKKVSRDNVNNYDQLTIEHGLDKFNFRSIGGTNQNNLSYMFYIGGTLNTSTLNAYDGNTFNNYWVDVTTINSYPGFNGTISFNNTYCYQEFANKNNECNNPANGSYSNIPSYNNGELVIDGNYSTGGYTVFAAGSNIYVNYTKPINTTGAVWRTKAGAGSENTVNIIDRCYNAYDDYIFLRIWAYGTRNVVNWMCYNTTDWIVLRTDTGHSAYEEGVFWEFPTDNGLIANLSNGTYSMEFYSNEPRYLNKTYTVNISNVTDYQLYNTSETLVHIIARSVVTGTYLDEINSTVLNTNTSDTRSQDIGNLTITSYPLNASYYLFNLSRIGISDYINGSFNVSLQDEITIYVDMFHLLNITLYDEKTLEIFDIGGTNRTTFILICPNETITTVINTSSPIILITCNYTKFRFTLEYELVSYYRTYILPQANLFNNTNIYLIDKLNTQDVFNAIIIDDLLSDYDDVSIYVTKNIEDSAVQITADNVDIENKIGTYLIENHEYFITITSSNQPTRNMGLYIATQTGDKIIRLYDVEITTETEGFNSDVFYTMSKLNVEVSDNQTDLFIIASYTDKANETGNVSLLIYEGLYGSGGETLLQNLTMVPTLLDGIQQAEWQINMSAYENSTISSRMVIQHVSGTYGIASLIQKITTIIVPMFNFLGTVWMNWIFTLLLSVLAIMATIKTGNYVSIACIGIAAVFVMFGWFGISASALALAMLMSIGSMLRDGEKNL